jgi:pimeloyl-ACP methyl ester carboxylesterase
VDVAVYLETDEGRLAGIVGLPRDPLGILVVLLAGGSLHGRSHRNRMWLRAARALERDGFSTLRLDLPGVGDSDGRLRRFDLEDPFGLPVSQAVRRVVRDTGATRVLMAGTCLGARVSLASAPLIPEATDVLYVAAPTLTRRPPVFGRAYKRAYIRITGWGRLARRLLPAPRRWDLEDPQNANRPISPSFSGPLVEFTQRGRVLFLFGERDKFIHDLRSAMARLGPKLPSGRIEIRVIPGMELHSFKDIPAQDRTIETTLDWVRSRTREVLPEPSRLTG